MTKKKDALTADTKQQGNSNEKAVGVTVPAEAQPQPDRATEASPGSESQSAVAQTEEFTLIDVPTLTEDQKKLCEQFNIPIEKLLASLSRINEYARSVETRFAIVAENIPTPEKIKAAMTESIEELRRKAQAQPQNPPQTGGEGGGIGLKDLLSLTGGGGGMDEEMMQLQKDMLRTSLDSMKEDIGFTRAIKNALVTKIAGKAVSEVL